MSTPPPDGATPLDPDEAEGLIPPGLLTRAQLNAWEQHGIRRARDWAINRRRAISLRKALDDAVLRDLHRRMFADTWTWAGRYRHSDKNIGTHWPEIPAAMRDALADAHAWIAEGTWPPSMLLARFHHRLVQIHPFPNGNGRWARLATEVLARALGVALPTWGAPQADARRAYLESLRAADQGAFDALARFMWA